MNMKFHFSERVRLMMYSHNCGGRPWPKSQRRPSMP